MKTKCASTISCKRVLKKKDKKTKQPRRTFDCGVCLDSKPCSSKASLKCGHSFCRKCISSWAKTETSCPLCRATFQSYKCQGKTVAVRVRRQTSEHGELFGLVIEATTKFLESKEYQNKVRDELIERKSGIEVLILCIHRSLQILTEEENRASFDPEKLFDALTESENLVEMVRSRTIRV